MQQNKSLLFIGLGLLLIGVLSKSFGVNANLSFLLIITGVIIKSIYLIQNIMRGTIKMTPMLYCLLIGIFFVLISMLFTYYLKIDTIGKMLFSFGILLKIVSDFYLLFKKHANKTRIICSNYLYCLIRYTLACFGLWC
jgi:hypothetical protein